MNTDTVFFNQSFDKKKLKALISWVLKRFGEKQALKIIEDLKTTGFHYATEAGLSIGLHDLKTPPEKPLLVSRAQMRINATERDFISGDIIATEMSQGLVDTWHRASEALRRQLVEYFSTYSELNPVYIMALSGARGNFSQVRQLIGMRGLMADPQGKIISFPIRSNLREGLTLTEYFISCSGARKGLVDTALRTADTGYLTRRLVDVSHHIVVKKVACATSRGIVIKSLQSNSKVLLPLRERLIGRVLAQDVYSKEGVSLGKKDEEISPKLALSISLIKKEVAIRSPLTCAFTQEVCQLCYGWSLSQGNLVSLGEAVGIIAAQSIGEPGTQLTMRTFHTGGVFSGDLLEEIRAPHSGTVIFPKALQGLLIRTANGQIAFLTKVSGECIITSSDYNLSPQLFVNSQSDLPTNPPGVTPPVAQKSKIRQTRLHFQALTMLFVRHGEQVVKDQLLAELSILNEDGNQPITTQQTLFANISGRVQFIQNGNTKYINEKEEKKSEIRAFWGRCHPCKSPTLGLFYILSTEIGAITLDHPFSLQTFAKEGDLVDLDYKNYTLPSIRTAALTGAYP
jgi:DNA-directed RNA polymerase subunit beta'